MTIDNALASVAVKNIKTAVQWYENVIGRPADSAPMPELAEWQFPIERGKGMLLINKIAVVYGAGGSIGAAVAIAFAREGARVFSFNAIDIADSIQGTPLIELTSEAVSLPVIPRVATNFRTARAAARHMGKKGVGVILMIVD